jgi:predicted peptidase
MSTTSPSPAELLRVAYPSPATGEQRDHFLYLPAGYRNATERRWPLLLFLHGNGERGDAREDLDYLLVYGPLYEAWIQKRDLPFVIVAPQLPMYGRDEHADYLRNRTRAQIPVRLAHGVPSPPPLHPTVGPMTAAPADDAVPHGPEGPPMGWPELHDDLIQILDGVLERERIDPEQQYLTGVSYGGFGTWYLASRHPQRFAAIAPVVGYAHPDHVAPLAASGVAVWGLGGGGDQAVPAQFFYQGMNRLEQLGHRDFRFTIEADMGHDVWRRAYAGRDLYDWMLARRRPPRRDPGAP